MAVDDEDAFDVVGFDDDEDLPALDEEGEEEEEEDEDVEELVEDDFEDVEDDEEEEDGAEAFDFAGDDAGVDSVGDADIALDINAVGAKTTRIATSVATSVYVVRRALPWFQRAGSRARIRPPSIAPKRC